MPLKDLPRELMHVLAALAPRAAVRAARACGELWGRFRDDPHLFLPAAGEVSADSARWSSVPPALLDRMPPLQSLVPVRVARAGRYALSPDGATVAVTLLGDAGDNELHRYAGDTELHRYAADSGALIEKRYAGNGRTRSVGFSPLGGAICVAEDHHVYVVFQEKSTINYFSNWTMSHVRLLSEDTILFHCDGEDRLCTHLLTNSQQQKQHWRQEVGDVSDVRVSERHVAVLYDGHDDDNDRLALCTHGGELLHLLRMPVFSFSQLHFAGGKLLVGYDEDSLWEWDLATGAFADTGLVGSEFAVRRDGKVLCVHTSHIELYGRAVLQPEGGTCHSYAWAGRSGTSHSYAWAGRNVFFMHGAHLHRLRLESAS